MSNYIIQVSSDALMEMSLAALEAYVIPQRQGETSKKSRIKTELETYGLLWGHDIILPDGDVLYHIRKLTVDSMAHKRNDSVWPSDGLEVIKDMITSYWPEYSFLGDFHSHPYEHYKDVESIKGYEFSEEDRMSMIQNKENDDDFRIALVMTIASLRKSSDLPPCNVSDNVICWTFNNYRFWLNACLVYKEYEEAEDEEENDGEIVLLPNSSHWEIEYESEEVGKVYLHCPYLERPWQMTEFGKKMRPGEHKPGID